MVRSAGYNATRRSRRIGTKSQGFGRRNDFSIPTDRTGRRFFEKLVNAVEVPMKLGDHVFVIIIEPTLPGFRYHVTVSDIVECLKLIPVEDRKDIAMICLRQPKRKEAIFSPVWGRMAYWAEVAGYEGPAVILEALPVNHSYKLRTSVSPAFLAELMALEGDGHEVVREKNRIIVSCPPEAIRATQLFRSLPHEIGHYADYRQKVLLPGDQPDADFQLLTDLYFARPQREREAFADRYATAVMAPFRQNDIVPFQPLQNRTDRLPTEWFYFDAVTSSL